jgi:hypothetical protein
MYTIHLIVSVVCPITGRQDNMVSLQYRLRLPSGSFGIAGIQSVLVQFTVINNVCILSW